MTRNFLFILRTCALSQNCSYENDDNFDIILTKSQAKSTTLLNFIDFVEKLPT